MNNNPSILLKCNCGCNVIEFNYDIEYNEFYVSLWEKGPSSRPLPKKERVRWCDYIMKTGKPWADHTVLNKANAKRLAKFLSKYTK